MIIKSVLSCNLSGLLKVIWQSSTRLGTVNEDPFSPKIHVQNPYANACTSTRTTYILNVCLHTHSWRYVWTPIYICIYMHIYSHTHPYLCCPDGWGCRIHRLHLCRGVRLPPNESPGYNTKQSDGKVPGLGNAEHPFIAIAPRSTLPRSGSTW